MGHIEPLAAVVRVPGDYLGPFTWAASVRYLSPTHVEIVAAMRMPTVSEMKDLRATLIAAGVTQATIKRVQPDGRVIERLLTA